MEGATTRRQVKLRERERERERDRERESKGKSKFAISHHCRLKAVQLCCCAHLRFQGLEPAVSKHSVLWTLDHTSSTTCRYLHGFYTGTHFAYPGGMTRLSWPGWLINY